MATIFIDSGASGSNDGSSWIDSYNSIDSVGATSAGDILFVAADHDEDIDSSTSYIELANGTFGNPVRLISATAGSDPVTYESGCTFRSIGNYIIKPGNNGVLAVWGNVWRADGAGDDLFIGYGNDSVCYFYHCEFACNDRFWSNYSTDSRTFFVDCELTLDASAGDCYMNGQRASLDWRGGLISAGQKDYVIDDAYGAQTSYRAVDLSGYTEGVNPHSSNKGQQHLFSGCAVGAGFSLHDVESTDGTDSPDQIMISEYCDTGTIASPIEGLTEKLDFGGRTTVDSARYRDSGAKSATSGGNYSHALKSRSSYGSPNDGHRSVELLAKVDGGSEITVTVFVASGGAIYNDELWMDVFGPSSDTTAQQEYGSTRLANPTATRATLTTDSTNTWTGSGVGTKQKMSYTWTPLQAGVVRVEITWAKGGGDFVYVDPRLELS